MRIRTHGLLAALLLIAVSSPVPAGAQAPASEDETIERILELERQIDELIATLSAEARQRLARRLAESGSAAEPDAAPGEPAAAAETAPPPPIAALPPPQAPPPPPAPEAPVRQRLTRRPSCNFLEIFDENQDGRVTALDRYWRHLYVWSDKNGDRQTQDDEVESAYAHDIREIATDLTTFVRRKGTLGEVRVDEVLRLDVRADGFGSPDDGVLVVDAGKLRRGSGPELRSADGATLEGFQPLRQGLRFRHGDGRVTELTCP